MTRFVNITIAAALAVFGLTSCVEVRSVSYESFYCSVNKNESPHYSCDDSRSNLVCIATYTLGEKKQPVHLCRVACTTHADCTSGGDVCCGGNISGETYGKSKACVPTELCQTDPDALKPVPKLDAGLADTGGNMSLPKDAAEDDAASSVDAPPVVLPDAAGSADTQAGN